MSNMTVLSRDLFHMGASPVICFNNKKLLHISRYQTYTPGHSNFESDNLYIVTDRDFSVNNHLMAQTGNFLIMGPAPHNMERHISSNTNVIFVDVRTPLSEIHTSIQRCCKAFNIFGNYSEQMLQAVFQKDSVTDYLNVCAEMFDHTVALFRNNRLVSVSSPSKSYYASLNEDAAEDSLDDTTIDLINGKEYEWVPGSRDDISYPELITSPDGREILITSFCPDGHSSFKFCVISPRIAKHGKVFANYDYPLSIRVVEMLIRIISSGASISTPLTFAQFFDRAISTTNRSAAMTISRAAELNFKPTGNTFMYMIYSMSNNKLNFSTIIDRISSSIDGIVFPYHSRIFLLTDEYQENCVDTLKDILKKEKSDCRIVRSLRLGTAADLKHAYSECMNAQRISKYYGGRDIFIPYEHLSEHLLLLRYQELSDDITDLALPIARNIIDYDTANGTDYKRTLSIYIHSFRNIQITADELNVHRNTIHFRLQKISELFNIDYDDYKLLHNIGFSLDIYESVTIYRDLQI